MFIIIYDETQDTKKFCFMESATSSNIPDVCSPASAIRDMEVEALKNLIHLLSRLFLCPKWLMTFIALG